MSLKTLLIDNYDSYTYNLFQILSAVNATPPIVLHNNEITLEEITRLLERGDIHNIVISPGPGSPYNGSDIGVCADVLKNLPHVPILGVCLGHQALALTHGGSVARCSQPVHGRLSCLEHTGHPLFAGIPSGPGSGFDVVRYHSLVVEDATLPPCLRAIAWTCGPTHALGCAQPPNSGPTASSVQAPSDPQKENGGLIMALAHTSQPHYGVQFHPESVATRFGIAVLQNFRNLTCAALGLHEPPSVPNVVGPPGALLPPQPWPSQAHQAKARLHLKWRLCTTSLANVTGGTQTIFEKLYRWQEDTFWLDSATLDRGRFSYMGGPGGPLWHRLTYVMPNPDPAQVSPASTDESEGPSTERHAHQQQSLQQQQQQLQQNACYPTMDPARASHASTDESEVPSTERHVHHQQQPLQQQQQPQQQQQQQHACHPNGPHHQTYVMPNLDQARASPASTDESEALSTEHYAHQQQPLQQQQQPQQQQQQQQACHPNGPRHQTNGSVHSEALTTHDTLIRLLEDRRQSHADASSSAPSSTLQAPSAGAHSIPAPTPISQQHPQPAARSSESPSPLGSLGANPSPFPSPPLGLCTPHSQHQPSAAIQSGGPNPTAPPSTSMGLLTLRSQRSPPAVIHTQLLPALNTSLAHHALGFTPVDVASLPFDFWGGYVGYLGYEVKGELGGVNAHRSRYADADLFFADRLVAIDHWSSKSGALGDIYVLAVYDQADEQEASLWVESTVSAIQQLNSKTCNHAKGQSSSLAGNGIEVSTFTSLSTSTDEPGSCQVAMQNGTIDHRSQPLCQTADKVEKKGLQKKVAHLEQMELVYNGDGRSQVQDQITCNGRLGRAQEAIPCNVERTELVYSEDGGSRVQDQITCNGRLGRAQEAIPCNVEQTELVYSEDSGSRIQDQITCNGRLGRGQEAIPSNGWHESSESTESNKLLQNGVHRKGGIEDQREAGGNRALITQEHESLEHSANSRHASCEEPSGPSLLQDEGGCSTFSKYPQPPPPFRLRHNRQQYLENVQACLEALHAGESYEICLTTALLRPASPNPVTLYKALRAANPAPYAAWLSFSGTSALSTSLSGSLPTANGSALAAAQPAAAGQPPLIVCCSSPERFLRASRGGVLQARPIKGTASRRSDPVEDAAAAAALAGSEKDRAENLMIVDLLRNDLGRVCEVGSVAVTGLVEVESYATVHQLVSTVEGVRREGVSLIDCLAATFPGGSMTGAPKLRTMEILDKLEGAARGPYSGCIGFLSINDTADLNIVIRTALVTPGASVASQCHPDLCQHDLDQGQGSRPGCDIGAALVAHETQAAEHHCDHDLDHHDGDQGQGSCASLEVRSEHEHQNWVGISASTSNTPAVLNPDKTQHDMYMRYGLASEYSGSNPQAVMCPEPNGVNVGSAQNLGCNGHKHQVLECPEQNGVHMGYGPKLGCSASERPAVMGAEHCFRDGIGFIEIGAGGAVVVQSDPEGEYSEMRLKATALLAAIGFTDVERALSDDRLALTQAEVKAAKPAAVDDELAFVRA